MAANPLRIAGSGAALAVLLTLLVVAPSTAALKRALFDNTHGETAGNADWQIDTDQPLPVPDQATVGPATPRTYWLGAISSWGIDLVKRGYQVATLTTPYGITFGSPCDPYDLSNFDVFIVVEPNKRFTAAESTAVFDYVRAGGGLVAIADHVNSDRDGDGIDSPRVWNALDARHLWGASFEVSGANSNFTEVYSTNVSTAPDDSVIFGPVGVARGLEFHNGAAMSLYPDINPSVRGCVWRSGAPHGTTAVMAARSVYGNGRIFWVGDSSPADDGSATPGNINIFDGWGEAGGNDSTLIMNGTMWATRRAASVSLLEPVAPRVSPVAANPAQHVVRFSIFVPETGGGSVEVADVAGHSVRTLAVGTLAPGRHELQWNGCNNVGTEMPTGMYFIRTFGHGYRTTSSVVWIR